MKDAVVLLEHDWFKSNWQILFLVLGAGKCRA